MKKLIPAICMLLISAMLLGTSTYAWFSMNNTVTVTGMAVKATVSDNLYIASSTAGNDKSADANFKSAVHQTVSGDLQPVSTISGLTGSYFTTTDAAANGSKSAATTVVPYTAITGTGDTFTINSTTYNAYVDYIVELKAVNASEAAKYVNLSKVNLLYKGATTTNHAFRVAVIAQEQATPADTLDAGAVSSAYAAVSTSAANTILAPTSFAYFDSTAVASTTTKAAVAPTVNNAGWSSSVAAGKTQYFKVTVRLWLEGEDTDCYNTKFVGLTKDWQLDLAFSFDDNDTAAATQIGSVANATNTLSTNKFTAALTNNETAATYQWYDANGDVAISGQTSADYTASTAITAYCAITTTEGNVYYTPAVSYTPAP